MSRYNIPVETLGPRANVGKPKSVGSTQFVLSSVNPDDVTGLWLPTLEHGYSGGVPDLSVGHSIPEAIAVSTFDARPFRMQSTDGTLASLGSASATFPTSDDDGAVPDISDHTLQPESETAPTTLVLDELAFELVLMGFIDRACSGPSTSSGRLDPGLRLIPAGMRYV